MTRGWLLALTLLNLGAICTAGRAGPGPPPEEASDKDSSQKELAAFEPGEQTPAISAAMTSNSIACCL